MTAYLTESFSLRPTPWFKPCATAIAHRNHYFHQYHRNATPENKKLFSDSRNHCKKVLKGASSNYAEPTRRSVASQPIGSCDFWRICNSILNRGKYTIPLLFNGPEVLTTCTDKANLFARNFSCNSTLDDGSQQLTDFPSGTEQKLSLAEYVFLPVGNLHRLCQFLKMMESDLTEVSIVLEAFFLLLVRSLSIILMIA